MKIVVVNGSPKGETSVTMQYLKYIKKNRNEHEYNIYNVAHLIKKYEKDTIFFNDCMNEIKKADLVLWQFPVYHFTVTGQLLRFIELIYERNAKQIFECKYSTALTTSIHFYDNLAHKLIREISEDMGMKYIRGYSAHMDDLFKADKRTSLLKYIDEVNNIVSKKRNVPVINEKSTYIETSYEYTSSNTKEATNNSKILLITDAVEEDKNLNNMIDTFIDHCMSKVEIINLNKIDFKGGCLGCCNCGFENECVYNDDLEEIYKEKMITADGIIFASKIKSRLYGAKLKMFFDRSFTMGHTPFYNGKQIMYILSGPVSKLSTLKEEIESRVDIGKNNLVSIISDEYDNETIKNLIIHSADMMNQYINDKYILPRTFREVGGQKVFRDFVYLSKAIFKSDYKYYKKHNVFDFPQKNIKKRFLNLLMNIFFSFKKVRKQVKKQMIYHMISPYKRIVEK